MFLFRVAFVCFLELDDVVVEVVGVRHVRGLDVMVVRNLADFIIHVSGVVVMLLQLRLCKSGVVCGVVACESSGRQRIWFVVNPVISRGLFFIMCLGATEPLDDSSLDFFASVNGALDAVGDARVRLLEERVKVGALVNRLEGHAAPSFVCGSVVRGVPLQRNEGFFSRLAPDTVGAFDIKGCTGAIKVIGVFDPNVFEGFGFLGLREFSIDDRLDIDVCWLFESGDVVGEDRLVDRYAVRDVVEASRVVPVVSDAGNKVGAQGVGNDGVDA